MIPNDRVKTTPTLWLTVNAKPPPATGTSNGGSYNVLDDNASPKQTEHQYRKLKVPVFFQYQVRPAVNAGLSTFVGIAGIEDSNQGNQPKHQPNKSHNQRPNADE
jgi:hypothetical protein